MCVAHRRDVVRSGDYGRKQRSYSLASSSVHLFDDVRAACRKAVAERNLNITVIMIFYNKFVLTSKRRYVKHKNTKFIE